MIATGGTYTILSINGSPDYIGDQIHVAEVLGIGDDHFYRVRGTIEGREGEFTLWARLGKPKHPLCNCPRMSFPHRRTPKCPADQT